MAGWGGGGYGCVGGVPFMHACTCTHARTCMLSMLNMINMDASMSVAICNFYTCIHVCVCMCMCAHVCACVWGHPQKHSTVLKGLSFSFKVRLHSLFLFMTPSLLFRLK